MAVQIRPPVVTIMGHVDHGKTTLLDYIRKSRVAAGEAGGITQHTGAYQVNFKGKPITFIDTPGHAAFNKMRERGAQITDIVVLVVAANDGVKPQTIESIRHIKNSGAAYLVAINKIDLADVHPENVKAQLAEHDVLVTDFGGDVEVVELSAKTGLGVDKLLETIVVMSELLELKADPQAPLAAVVIESTKDEKRGSLASVIVQSGTLKPRQNLVCEAVTGRVKALFNDHGVQLAQATPGDPAEIVGLKDVPAVGAIIHDADADYPVSEPDDVEPSTDDQASLDVALLAAEHDPFADLDFDSAFGEKEKLKLLIRADVEGTLEVIHQNLDEDQVIVVDSGVGQVTDTDIERAATSGATIIAFHIKVPARIKAAAKEAGVRLRVYEVIYKLIEDLQKQILKLIEPTIDEVVTGEAEILQIFDMKGEKIAGVRVKTGEITKTDKVHLKRADAIIADPIIKSMMHGKEEITGIKAKNEGGITFRPMKKSKLPEFAVGDMIVAYHLEDEE